MKTIKEAVDFGEGKPVVYIAGKVTGLDYDTEVFPKFRDAQLELESQGFVVINPCEVVAPDADWVEAMRICLSLLPIADSIYLLPDWEKSKGARFEKEVAERLQIPVFNN